MKTRKPVTLAFLVIASMALFTSNSPAATTTYSADDLFIGFRQTGNTNDYLIDIGQSSIYRDAITPLTLNLGNVLIDLNNVFGSNWKNDSSVFWGVVGTPGASTAGGDPGSLLYASKAESPFGTSASLYPQNNSITQNNTASDILSMKNAYVGVTSSTNSSVAIIQSSSPSTSWASLSSSSFNGAFPGMEGNFGSGASQTALDLIRIPTTTAGAATNEGRFLINGTTGAITFQPAAVPEPSTVAILSAGAALLAVAHFRRRSAKA